MTKKIRELFNSRGATDVKSIVQIMVFSLVGIAAVVAIIYFVFLLTDKSPGEGTMAFKDIPVLTNSQEVLYRNVNVSNEAGAEVIEAVVDARNLDSDEDGLSDYDEINLHRSDPQNPDTDGDGYPDGHEVDHGYSPIEVFSAITVLDPKAEAIDTKQTRYEVVGTNTENVTKVRVEFRNTKMGLSDDYFLTKFKPGDTVWKYTADSRYKNLAFGKNLYKISAYQEDKWLATENLVINLTELPGTDSIVYVDWEDNLIAQSGSEDYIDEYLVGKVTSGIYSGHTLYLRAGQTLGGYEFDHYVIKDGVKVRFKENNIRIADFEYLPETMKLPGTKYYFEKGYSSSQYFKDFHVIKKLFTHETLGDVYLAYPKSRYESSLKPGYDDSAYGRLYSCVVVELPDHTALVYHVAIEFYIDDQRGVGILDATFVDGSASEDSYTYTEYGGCGAYCKPMTIVAEEDLRPDERFIVAGTTSDGETLYEFKNPRDGFLVNLYNDKTTLPYYDQGRLEESKYTYDEFIAIHPVLYWKDPLDRWIRFKNKKLIPMAEMCKPVIYLYPEKTAKISVKVRPNGGFTHTDPDYGQGWEVVSDPNSRIIDQKTGLEHEYLFWEGIGLNYFTDKEGFVVSQKETSKFFDEKLAILGLQGKEIKDFKEYWVDRLSEKPYYLITFVPIGVFNDVAPLQIEPKPDSIIRVMMHAQGLDAPISIAEQKLETPKRERFTVVEWGGAVVR